MNFNSLYESIIYKEELYAAFQTLYEKTPPDCGKSNPLAGVFNPMRATYVMDDDKFMKLPFKTNAVPLVFKNRDLKDGTLVTVRLDIAGSGKAKFPISTIHTGKGTNKALGYDYLVNLDNVTFYVNQGARAKIVSCKENKFPMAGSVGKINNKRTDDDVSSGTICFFNPKKHHLFVDMKGFAVKSAKSCTNYGMAVFCKGVEYWSEKDAPKPQDDWDSEVKYKS